MNIEKNTEGEIGVETNKCFKRIEADVKTLSEGEKMYADLGGNTEELHTELNNLAGEFVAHVATLIVDDESEKSEKRLQEIRILFNGVMYAAGKNEDPDTAMHVKDMIEGMFGLDGDI